MTEPKWTPGEWQRDGIAIVDGRHTVCLMGEPAQYAHDTARLCENHEANASLIAAAPDMADALARVEPNIGWRGTPESDLDGDLYACEFCAGTAALREDVPHHDECLVHVIRTALAQARGEDQTS